MRGVPIAEAADRGTCRQRIPKLESCYIDCQGSGQALCAQHSVFSLPRVLLTILQLWFDGRKFTELVRVFTLSELREAIARPYQIAFS